MKPVRCPRTPAYPPAEPPTTAVPAFSAESPYRIIAGAPKQTSGPSLPVPCRAQLKLPTPSRRGRNHRRRPSTPASPSGLRWHHLSSPSSHLLHPSPRLSTFSKMPKRQRVNVQQEHGLQRNLHPPGHPPRLPRRRRGKRVYPSSKTPCRLC